MDELDKLKQEQQEKNDSNSQYGQFVPSSYFENLESRILSQVIDFEKEPIAEVQSKRKIYTLLRYGGVAAALLILFLGISKFDSESIETAEYAEVSELEQVDYLLKSEEFYAEDLLEIDGIDEVLTELEQQLNDK